MPHPTRQVAIVTGALGGIGRAKVRRLLQDGWAVAASYAQGVETPERAMALKDKLGEHSDRISLHPLNLAQSASIREFFADALAAWGRLDALVNNPGCSGLCRISTSRRLTCAATNLTSPGSITRPITRQMAFWRATDCSNRPVDWRVEHQCPLMRR